MPQLLARVLFLRLLALTGFQHAADALATARDLLAVPPRRRRSWRPPASWN